MVMSCSCYTIVFVQLDVFAVHMCHTACPHRHADVFSTHARVSPADPNLYTMTDIADICTLTRAVPCCVALQHCEVAANFCFSLGLVCIKSVNTWLYKM